LQQVLFLKEEFYFWDKNFFLVFKKKVPRIKFLCCENKPFIARKEFLGCILRNIILELGMSFSGWQKPIHDLAA